MSLATARSNGRPRTTLHTGERGRGGVGTRQVVWRELCSGMKAGTSGQEASCLLLPLLLAPWGPRVLSPEDIAHSREAVAATTGQRSHHRAVRPLCLKGKSKKREPGWAVGSASDLGKSVPICALVSIPPKWGVPGCRAATQMPPEARQATEKREAGGWGRHRPEGGDRQRQPYPQEPTSSPRTTHGTSLYARPPPWCPAATPDGIQVLPPHPACQGANRQQG